VFSRSSSLISSRSFQCLRTARTISARPCHPPIVPQNNATHRIRTYIDLSIHIFLRSPLCKLRGQSVRRIQDVHACLVMRHDLIPFIASIAQVQSGSITKATANIVMGDIRCICYRADHNLRKYCHSSYDSGVSFRLLRRDMFSFSSRRYFAAYFLAVAIFFMATQNKTRLLGWVYWIYDQSPVLHTWRLTRRWGDRIINTMTRLRKQPVCILTRTDEVCEFIFYPEEYTLRHWSDQSSPSYGALCQAK
jgi:hypothetical protein